RLGISAVATEQARQQDASIADDQEAGFEDEREVKVARRALDHGGIGFGMWRRLVVLAVGNAEAATQVDMADGVAVGAQGAHEIGRERKSIVERLELRDL